MSEGLAYSKNGLYADSMSCILPGQSSVHYRSNALNWVFFLWLHCRPTSKCVVFVRYCLDQQKTINLQLFFQKTNTCFI